jgi:hypothetical protein
MLKMLWKLLATSWTLLLLPFLLKMIWKLLATSWTLPASVCSAPSYAYEGGPQEADVQLLFFLLLLMKMAYKGATGATIYSTVALCNIDHLFELPFIHYQSPQHHKTSNLAHPYDTP